MINLAHSLHGNIDTNMVEFFKSASFLFKIAFNSAWQTNGYFVSKIEPFLDFLDHGKTSSEQFFGNPL